MTEISVEIEAEQRTRIRTPAGNRTLRVTPPEPGLAEQEAPRRVLWPETQLDTAEILQRSETYPDLARGSHPVSSRSRRRVALRCVLSWLATFPGDSWQEKWEASGVEDDPNWMETITNANLAATGTSTGRFVSNGAMWLIAAGVIRPSYEWMHRQHETFRTLYRIVLGLRDPEGMEAIADAVERNASSALLRQRYRVDAHYQLARILAHTGKMSVREVSLEDLARARNSAKGQQDRLPSGAAFNAMSWAGFLPEDAPKTFRDSLRTGPLAVDEMVDRTGIRSQKVRALLVDYLRARSASLDYTSLSGLAVDLVKNFWVEIEHLSPGIETLNLSPELVDAWKDRIRTIRHGVKTGMPRKDHGGILVTVRGFYFDINDWAQVDPERYGEFAAPNPIRQEDTVAFAKAKRRQRAHSHQRTRERLPHLPALMNAVESGWRWHRQALQAARECNPGEAFEVDGITCQVTRSIGGSFGGVHGGLKRVGGLTVQRMDTGEYFDAVQREAIYFWRWAAFNVLKETGIRIEEMEELTHASITQYRVPSTGELLPLLQIAPSKTDQERVLLISPGLADVLATLISRVRSASPTGRIPLVTRWDYHEKVLSEPMPFLFQRPIDGQNRTVNRAWVLVQLRHTVEEIGLVGEDGEPIYFQNHDLRRLFATEAVMAGLPVHILAQVMGHESLDTTQQYTAIFEEDVYRRHRAFIERRRAIRPSVEYREPTETEWQEFLGHFERRQLELGVCGRAYGTPCVHEHACVRCSMLHVDPAMRPRLEEIAANLETRIAEAKSHGWFGEIEGLSVSLAAAQDKLATLDRRQTKGQVSLGIPGLRADLQT